MRAHPPQLRGGTAPKTLADLFVPTDVVLRPASLLEQFKAQARVRAGA